MAQTDDDSPVRLTLVPAGRQGSEAPPPADGLQPVTLTQRLTELTRQLALTRALLADKERECQELACSITHHAHLDELTGLLTRRRFNELWATEIARSERYGAPLALIMANIDHFGRVNDAHGHRVGDRALASMAKVLGSRTRAQDLLCRWSGEEFLMLAPHLDLNGALLVAEKLRSAVEQADFGEAGRLTCSFGVAVLAADEEAIDLLLRADTGLYRAKRGGRNRVVAQADGDAAAADPEA